MCISRNEAFDYVKAILTEIAELFPYEHSHVGTDEINMTDVTNKNSRKQRQNLTECELCNKLYTRRIDAGRSQYFRDLFKICGNDRF